jgi:hypothetical protein
LCKPGKILLKSVFLIRLNAGLRTPSVRVVENCLGYW